MKQHLRLNVLTAFVFVAVGLLVNVWSVGDFFAPLVKNGKMVFETKALIWCFQAFLIISGLLVFFKGGTPQGRKRLVFAYIAAILMVVFVEIALHFLSFATNIDKDGLEGDRLLSLSAYRDKEWAETLFREYSDYAATIEYEQFLGWAIKGYSGEYINVDEEGARKTWNPEGVDSSAGKTVYIFGGSTLLGWQARDEHTVPSYLSRFLNEGDGQYVVSNYGQIGYSFTQEIMKLILLLREEHRPDYVLFYDGANDVYTAYQTGEPGLVQNTIRTRKKLKRKEHTPLQHFMLSIKGALMNHSMIYRALRKLPALFVKSPKFKEPGARYTDRQLQSLAEGISNHYLESMDLLMKLSIAYGFEYLCFWQPVVFTESTLLPEERGPDGDPRAADEKLGSIHKETIRLLEAQDPADFHNIQDALAARSESVYSDVCHLSEQGNEIVAAKIAEIFKDRFDEQR